MERIAAVSNIASCMEKKACVKEADGHTRVQSSKTEAAIISALPRLGGFSPKGGKFGRTPWMASPLKVYQ